MAVTTSWYQKGLRATGRIDADSLPAGSGGLSGFKHKRGGDESDAQILGGNRGSPPPLMQAAARDRCKIAPFFTQPTGWGHGPWSLFVCCWHICCAAHLAHALAVDFYGFVAADTCPYALDLEASAASLVCWPHKTKRRRSHICSFPNPNFALYARLHAGIQPWRIPALNILEIQNGRRDSRS